ncbi:hypothetical protein B0T12DRAFT_361726 [Alternaria alternata]|nr:hypothetical protein B0T12DRAFT_361726 [Alternaria alternata]
MDDLFDGYMVLDGIGDFLESSVPASHPKALVVPHTEQHTETSKQAIRPKKDSLDSSDPRSTTASSGDTVAPGGLRQRRGHTKSRLGCIPCKRRKIKYPYLMDAMLALAGSHLAIQVENPKTSLALQHRQKAIVGLEDSFSRWPPTAEESHIMLATSYLLCFQSSYMEDGFLEHFLSLRGCSFLSQLILGEGFRGPFSDQKALGMIRMDTTFCNFPVVDQELLREALLSIKGLSSLMTGPIAHPIEKAIVGQLIETLQCLLVSESNTTSIPGTALVSGFTKASTLPQMASGPNSPSDLYAFANPILPGGLGVVFDKIDWENLTTAPPGAPYPLQSFIAVMAILTIFSTWPHDGLMHVFDPTNQLGNVVMAHFCAIRFVLSPLSAPRNALTTPIRATAQWSAQIIAAIDDDESGEWAQYVEWPKKILRCMEECIEKHKGFTMEGVRDMLLRDPGAFKEGRGRNY